MSVWSAIKRGLGATDEPTRQDRPLFEHLEPRLLLSADPAGLAAQNSLDFLDGPVDAEAAIVIDFEPVASEGGLQFPDHGSQITDIESQEGESSQDHLTSGLLVSSPSESLPAPSDGEGITEDRLQTPDSR